MIKKPFDISQRKEQMTRRQYLHMLLEATKEEAYLSGEEIALVGTLNSKDINYIREKLNCTVTKNSYISPRYYSVIWKVN